MPSHLVALEANQPLTPAQLSMVWEIAALLDERGIKPVKREAVWIDVPTSRLKGPDAADNNRWLRHCFERLSQIQLGGRQRDGSEWGAVLLAEWELEPGSQVARLLLPPAAVAALRTGATFTKLEIDAAHRLPPNARRLYAVLADRKRQKQQHWTYTLDELRRLLGLIGKYPTWPNFKKRVIADSVEAINAYGTVRLTWKAVRTGRYITGVRFEWAWKDTRDATSDAAENDRHSDARGKSQAAADAPPLIQDEARAWWLSLAESKRTQISLDARRAAVVCNDNLVDPGPAVEEWAYRRSRVYRERHGHAVPVESE